MATDTSYDPDDYDIETTALEGSYPADELGKTAKAFVWYVREHPDASREEIVDAIGSTQSTVNNYVRNYSHLIPKDASVWLAATRPETKGIEKLTDQQREIVELTYEMPDASVKEIGKASGSSTTNAQVVTKVYAHLLSPQFRRNNPQLLDAREDVINNPHNHRSPEHLQKLYEAVRADHEPPEPTVVDEMIGATDDEDDEDEEESLTTEEPEPEPDAYPGSQITNVDQRVIDRLTEEAEFHLEHAVDGSPRLDYAAGMIRVLEEFN